MSLAGKLKTMFRGDIRLQHLPLEFVRRRKAAKAARAERDSLDELNARPARLLPEFTEKSSADLLEHFRTRESPSFWPSVPVVWRDEDVIRDADRIVDHPTWEVMGFGPIKFEGGNCWRRDPLSGHDWGLEYHADTPLYREDGPDVRVLWEVNRFGHGITLALAYSSTNDERYAETFFSQVESWIEQNPYSRGANWSCAMEVALRAANMLAAFDILRTSGRLNEGRLLSLLKLFDQHGTFIVDNSEFSFVATSNHYLCDVVGLFWIGTLMPELELARAWRETGFAEMLHEMDEQVLQDGVDFEASTGYHRFVTEMLLMSFLLARKNDVEIAAPYWEKLRSMMRFVRDVTRPDGLMPMVGDCDGSRFVPVTRAGANETNYLLQIGASFLNDRSQPVSVAYPDAGIYILRDDDLYLAFNATDSGLNGRGSHGHNDALSIEVWAHGVPFIVDPGSYAYNLDRKARHAFRSTAYHSTVMVDGEEQNSTNVETPFIIGNEAKPRVLEWSTSATRDVLSGEHGGYRRLRQPVTHRRTVTFTKHDRAWLVDDALSGAGEHELQFVFHFAPGVKVVEADGVVTASRGTTSLVVAAYKQLAFEKQKAFVSRNYGQREVSTVGVWSMASSVPLGARFAIVPVGPNDDADERLELALRLAHNK